MFSKIFIFALLSCSLVLANPVQEKEEQDDEKFIEFNVPIKVKPEVAYKWLSGAGNVVKNSFTQGTNSVRGTLGSFYETGKNFLENGGNKIYEIISALSQEDFDKLQEKDIKEAIANLNEIVDHLKKQLNAKSANEAVETAKNTVENVPDKGSELYNKGKDFVNHLPKPTTEDVSQGIKDDVNVGGKEVINAVDTFTHKIGEFGSSINDASNKGVDRIYDTVDSGFKQIDQYKFVDLGIFSSTESSVNHRETSNQFQNQEKNQNNGFFGNAGQKIGNRVDGRIKNLSKNWGRLNPSWGK